MIADRPAAVSNDLPVHQSATSNCMTEHRDGILDKIVFGKRATPAEVAQSPASMLDEGIFICFGDDLHQILKTSCSDDIVSVENAITADVSDGPDCLLDDAWVV